MIWKSLTAFLVAASLVGGGEPEQSQVRMTRSRGWRGDGTGRFPEADPPTKWGRISRTLKGLTTQAERPKGATPDKSAHPMLYGTVDEWLILGPFDVPSGGVKETLDKDILANESAIQPDAGQKAPSQTWKKVQAHGAFLDFNAHFPDLKGKAVYAHTYVHSKTGGKVLARFKSTGCRVLFNGKEIQRREREWGGFYEADVEVAAGWNHLMVKVLGSQDADPNFNFVEGSCFF